MKLLGSISSDDWILDMVTLKWSCSQFPLGYFVPTFIVFCHRKAGAYVRCHWTRGRVHLRQVASTSSRLKSFVLFCIHMSVGGVVVPWLALSPHTASLRQFQICWSSLNSLHVFHIIHLKRLWICSRVWPLILHQDVDWCKHLMWLQLVPVRYLSWINFDPALSW